MKVLLLSGGIDSSALAWWKRPDLAVTINYGQQSANGEMAAAEAIASEIGIPHEVLVVDLAKLGLGPLAGKEPSSLANAPEWWPYRNQMLLTLAAMRFVGEGLSELLIGSVNSDSHADGTTQFVRAIDGLMALQEGKVRVSAPAIAMSTEGLLSQARFPRELLGLTFSCHVMNYACGSCRGCLKHNTVLSNFSSASSG